MSMKTFNRSRRERALRPPKPEFAMTGILVGMVAGWLISFSVEVLLKQKAIVMMLGGIAGVVLGAGFEAIRFWWRMRRFHAAKNSKP